MLSNLAVVLSVAGIYFEKTFWAEFCSLLAVSVSLLIGAKIRLSILFVFIFCFSSIIYFFLPGPLKIFVPLIPLVGLFFTQPRFSEKFFHKHKIKIILFSLSIITLVNYIFYLSYSDGQNSVNIQSQYFLFLIFLNIIYFNKPVEICVFACVTYAFILNPNGFGNRSSLFLLLFLINGSTVNFLVSKFFETPNVKKIMPVFLLAAFFTVLSFSILLHPTIFKIYEDERFIIWIDIYKNFGFFKYNEFMDINYFNKTNPHNSFLYVIMFESMVGIIKVLLFLVSIFYIPLTVWLPIFLRASFDSFFLVGPLSIYFFLYLRTCIYNSQIIKTSKLNKN